MIYAGPTPVQHKPEAVEILLRLFLDGCRIKHEGYTYAMGTDGALCVVHSKDDSEFFPIAIDCDIKAFKKMADDIGYQRLLRMSVHPEPDGSIRTG